MRADWILTENFRLLESQKVTFSPGINVITGENAQGKTTLLEAVYLLSGGKSFRAGADRELIAFDSDRACVTGGFFSGEPSRKVRRLRRCLTIFTGVISSSGAIVADMGVEPNILRL